MKKNLHPQYHPKAKVKCACGNEFTVGSTKKELDVESCSACHPFYTGEERGAVRGGRVERFQKRAEKRQELKHSSRQEKKKKLQQKRQAK